MTIQSSLQDRIEAQFNGRVLRFIAMEMGISTREDYAGWTESMILEHAKSLSQYDQTFSGLGSDWPHDRAVTAYANHIRRLINLGDDAIVLSDPFNMPDDARAIIEAQGVKTVKWVYDEVDAAEYERATNRLRERVKIDVQVAYYLSTDDNRRAAFFLSSPYLPGFDGYFEVVKGHNAELEVIKANAALQERAYLAMQKAENDGAS